MDQKPNVSNDFTQQIERLSNLLRWIAELIIAKNWFTLLILVAIGGLFLLNPHSGLLFKAVGLEPTLILPNLYRAIFWLVEAGLLIAALVVAVVTMPRSTQLTRQTDTTEPKVIKGLRPFEAKDAQMFRRLQRHRSLEECLDSITSPAFRFGILYGESGCGKTSFLQAGLQPQLTAPEASHRGVYVRFSDQDPILTVAKVIAEQLEVPLEWLLLEQHNVSSPDKNNAPAQFLKILTTAVEAVNKPLILLFDQFEQFFVHYRRRETQAPFVEALAAWYRNPNSLSVKILVSIRSDLMFQLGVLHQALGYALGPQETFELKKFTPREATEILNVIADAEGIDFNRKFIEELAEEELADDQDGRISPVNLQILAWMLGTQNASELRAFNRDAFQKFGGVEGLLQRFLERTLNARVISNQRQSAVKVLLALTDLDRQVRVGALTESDLEVKLEGTVQPRDIKEAVSWLVQGNVRLITPQELDGKVAYELAHERLIPALMRQAGKELSAADAANRLLDRRVNEWLGNHKNKRYLLGLKELWAIKQQRPYIMWGQKREQKEKLLQLSWKKRIQAGVSLLAVILLTIGGLGWLWFSPAGQIQRIKTMILFQLYQNGPKDVADAATSFAKNDDWQTAFFIMRTYPSAKGDMLFIQQTAEVVHLINRREQALLRLKQVESLAENISNNNSLRSHALSSVARAHIEFGNDLQAVTLLKQAIQSTQNIQLAWSKSSALQAITQTAGELSDSSQAAELLGNALTIAETIQYDRSKSSALQAIAQTAGELSDSSQAAELLGNALTVVETIQDDRSKSSALQAIAQTAGELSDSSQTAELLGNALTIAETIQDDFETPNALRAIARTAEKLSDSNQAAELLADALTVAQTIQDNWNKPNALQAIARTAGELGNSNQVAELLADVLTVAQTIQDDRGKSFALQEIAHTYAELGDSSQAAELFTNAFTITQSIQENWDKSDALKAIAHTYAELGDSNQAAELLGNALTVAQTIQGDGSKSSALQAITQTAEKLSDSSQAAELLGNALTVAQTIQDDGSKSSALQAITQTAEKLSDSSQAAELLGNALTIAETIQYDRSKSSALQAIAQTAGELSDSNRATELLSNALTVVETIQDDGSKSSALQAIAQTAGELSDSSQAAELLGNALTVAQTIQDDGSKSSAFNTIAENASILPSKQLVNNLLEDIQTTSEKERVLGPSFVFYELHAKLYKWEKALNALPVSYTSTDILSESITLEAERKNPILIPGAVVLDVKSFEKNSNYTFEISLKSPDQNCNNRTDWLEIITTDGKLVERQFIEDPYPASQPFTQNIANLSLDPEQEVLIRAHHYDVENGDDESGYNDQAFRGSIKKGFEMVRISERFASWLEKTPPLPDYDMCED